MTSARLSWIALLLAAGALVACHLHWMPLLPERVATHFDSAGRANGWMSRARHAWSSPFVHLGMAAFIVGLTSFWHRLPPGLLNLPYKDHWRQPEHYPVACAFLREWSRWLATVLLVGGILMDRLILQANQTKPPRLDSAAIGMLTACMLAAIATAVFWLLLRFLRKPPGTNSPTAGPADSSSPARNPSRLGLAVCSYLPAHPAGTTRSLLG